MTTRSAILALESLKWAFERSCEVQSKSPGAHVNLTPEFMALLHKTIEQLTAAIQGDNSINISHHDER